MASIYYPTEAEIYTRIVGTTGMSELHISTAPDIIFVLTGSYPYTSSIVFIQSLDTSSHYPITASWVDTASFAMNGGGGETDYIGVQTFS